MFILQEVAVPTTTQQVGQEVGGLGLVCKARGRQNWGLHVVLRLPVLRATPAVPGGLLQGWSGPQVRFI